MNVDFIESWGSDLSVVNAARVSFDKHSNELVPKDEKLIHYLAKHKHTSCFEHMGATLKLKVPIFIARQIQRHRTFSYNEISRRYVDSEPEFFWPDKWRARAENAKQGSSDSEVTSMEVSIGWHKDCPAEQITECPVELHIRDAFESGRNPNTEYRYFLVSALHMYQDMLDSGIAPELARIVLPQSLYTEFYMSGNLRAWSHFLHLRLDGHAQKEVQDVAQMVADILTPLFPVSMQALLENP